MYTGKNSEKLFAHLKKKWEMWKIKFSHDFSQCIALHGKVIAGVFIGKALWMNI